MVRRLIVSTKAFLKPMVFPLSLTGFRREFRKAKARAYEVIDSK